MIPWHSHWLFGSCCGASPFCRANSPAARFCLSSTLLSSSRSGFCPRCCTKRFTFRTETRCPKWCWRDLSRTSRVCNSCNPKSQLCSPNSLRPSCSSPAAAQSRSRMTDGRLTPWARRIGWVPICWSLRCDGLRKQWWKWARLTTRRFWRSGAIWCRFHLWNSKFLSWNLLLPRLSSPRAFSQEQAPAWNVLAMFFRSFLSDISKFLWFSQRKPRPLNSRLGAEWWLWRRPCGLPGCRCTWTTPTTTPWWFCPRWQSRSTGACAGSCRSSRCKSCGPAGSNCCASRANCARL